MSKNITIFGSGFGLYGYLPAILSFNEYHVLLQSRYREKLLKRDELANLSHKIEWCDDAYHIINKVDTCVIALPPIFQKSLLRSLLPKTSISRILIEKPMAESPDKAFEILNVLKSHEKTVSVGYVFLYTNWYKELTKAIIKNKYKRIEITWHHLAHHYGHNLSIWKRFNSMGGGAIRFYGIHLIAVIASLRYKSVSKSYIKVDREDEISRWSAKFTCEDKPDIHIDLDTLANEQTYRIRGVSSDNSIDALVELTDPFNEEVHKSTQPNDIRVGYLIRMCEDFFLPTYKTNWVFLEKVIELWAKSEELSLELGAEQCL